MRIILHVALAVLLFIPISIPGAGSPSAEEFFKRGLTRYAAGDLDGAIADFSRAIEINSGFTENSSRQQRGLSHNAIATPPASRSTGVVIVDRFNADAYYNRGRVRLEGDTDGALTDLNTAIRLDTSSAPAYVSRGRVFKAKGALESAIRDFRKAIELDPSCAVAYYNCGTIQSERKEFREAIISYARAVEIDPRMAMAFNNRGNAYAFIGNFRPAIDDYARAIELDPRLAMAYANRGLILLLQGRQAEADKDLTQCLKLEPDMADKIRELSDFAVRTRKP